MSSPSLRTLAFAGLICLKERDLRGAGRALLRAVSSELSDEEDEDEDEDEASACFEGRLLSRFRRAGFLS